MALGDLLKYGLNVGVYARDMARNLGYLEESGRALKCILDTWRSKKHTCGDSLWSPYRENNHNYILNRNLNSQAAEHFWSILDHHAHCMKYTRAHYR